MYITKATLKGFDTYKYSCKDTSPLAVYVMHPFWNNCVKLCPRWIAPNLLTLSGFLFLIAQSLLLAYYDPTFDASNPGSPAPVPKWVWWFSAFAQFASHTLDGIDGKQARRTGSSSPLGELFDHGIDSWSVGIITMNAFSVFGRQAVEIHQLYWVLITTMVAFLLSHWEKYNTGILYLPWAYDFSQVAISIMYVLTAMFGVDYWRQTWFGIYPSDAFMYCMYSFTFLVSVPTLVYNIVQAYAEGRGKQPSVYEAMLPLVSPAFLFTTITLWVYYSANDVIINAPRELMFLLATLFSNITCRLIVSQMSSTRCQFINKLTLFICSSILSLIYFKNTHAEVKFLNAVLTFAVLSHLHYATVLVDALAEHLNIRVFKIKPKAQ